MDTVDSAHKVFPYPLDILGMITLTKSTVSTMIEKTESKGFKPAIGARIPHEVHAEFLRVKEATGKTESELVNQAIALFLGIDAAATVPDRLSQVEVALAELQQSSGEILGKFRRLAID